MTKPVLSSAAVEPHSRQYRVNGVPRDQADNQLSAHPANGGIGEQVTDGSGCGEAPAVRYADLRQHVGAGRVV